MLRLITAILFFAASLTAYAQPYTACFNISSPQICEGQIITFTDCSGSPAGMLHTDVGTSFMQLDGTVSSAIFSYPEAGVYHPYQIVNDGIGGNSNSAPKTITVVSNSSAPTFTIGTCAGNQVTINITDSNYDVYTIAWGDGNTSTAAPLGSATYSYAATGTYSITVTGSFTTATCTSTSVSTSVTTLNSLIAPVIDDLTVNSQQVNGSITLRFSALPTQRYQIQEQQGGGGYFDKMTVQYQSGSQTLTFTGLATSVDPFYYRISAYDDCGPALYSDDIYSTILNGTGSNTQIELSWFNYNTFLTSNFNHYDLLRDGIVIANGLTTNSYTDLAVSTNQTYMYQVITYTNTGSVAYSAYIPVTTAVTSVTSARGEEVGFNPNPSAEGIFRLENNKAEFYDEIFVSNTEGKILFSLTNVSDSQIILDLSSAKPGMYIATLKNSKGVKVARLVK